MKLTTCNLIPIIRKLSDMTCKTISITPVEILLKGGFICLSGIEQGLRAKPSSPIIIMIVNNAIKKAYYSSKM